MSRGRHHTLTLTGAQQHDLAHARDHDPRPYFRARCAAVLKVAAGQRGRQVAWHDRHKPRDPATLDAWLDAYAAHGLAGLAQRPRGHRGFSPQGEQLVATVRQAPATTASPAAAGGWWTCVSACPAWRATRWPASARRSGALRSAASAGG